MIKRLTVFALTAVFTAFIAAPTALEAKDKQDERAKMKEARQKVRETYEGEKKGGFTFYDLAYWVDVKKLEDGRWSKQDLRDPKHDRGVQLYAKWANEASAAPGMTIDVFVFKLLHSDAKSKYSQPFDNIGESIEHTDVEGLANGFYKNWCRGAKDVIEDQSQEPKKSKLKLPKYEAAATATDSETNERVRREWYLWLDGKQNSTYCVEIRYGAALIGKENLLEKGPEFVKNMKVLKDKRVEWPR